MRLWHDRCCCRSRERCLAKGTADREGAPDDAGGRRRTVPLNEPGGMNMPDKKKVKPKGERLEKRATPKIIGPKDPKGPDR